MFGQSRRPGSRHWATPQAGLEEHADRYQIGRPVPAVQSALWVSIEVGWTDDREAKLVRGDFGVATGIVEGALLAAVNAADSHPVRLVEERDRPIVLALSVLHHELALGPVAVNGQFDAAPVNARVST
jgi:hypothetical protein